MSFNAGNPLPEVVSGEWREEADSLHPVLRRNPISGREAIFVSPAYVRHINGLPAQDSAQLLEELYGHMLQPAYTYRHRWCEGDMLVWDNGRLLHQATTLEMPPGAERLM